MSFVLPGDKLSLSGEENVTGLTGTYLLSNGNIHANIVGSTVVDESGGQTTVSVIPPRTHRIMERVLDVGDLVTCKVTRIATNTVNMEIFGAGDVVLPHQAMGLIRREDITLTETDKLVIHDCFRPGDIVMCRILSLGDSRQYFLTTAPEECGVIWAKSSFADNAGKTSSKIVALLPESPTSMVCPVTGRRESRKVAQR